MRATIVRPDNTVIVDGVAKAPVDCSSVDPTIRVIQWFGAAGWIEYNNDLAAAMAWEKAAKETEKVVLVKDDKTGQDVMLPPAKLPPYVFKPNEPIDSIAPWQSIIDAWNAWVPPPVDDGP